MSAASGTRSRHNQSPRKSSRLTDVTVFTHEHLTVVDLVLVQDAANFALRNLRQLAGGVEGDATARFVLCVGAGKLGLWVGVGGRCGGGICASRPLCPVTVRRTLK